jgi:SAM-dependent methyltransferase
MTRVDIGFLPTPTEVVAPILELAQLTSADLLYDLGSGDGRILIAAAQHYGTHGVGIDSDPKRIQEARQNAEKAGVADLITFYQQDLYITDLSPATVVMLYLLPHLNMRLRPQLLSQLKPGSRIVSLDFDMGDWRPQQCIQVPTAEDVATLYRWTISREVSFSGKESGVAPSSR